MIYFAPTPDKFIDQGDLIDECPVVSIIVDFRRLHTVRLDLLLALCRSNKRLARVQTPYREHLAKHFADTFSRIGLPQPYETM